MKKKSIISKGIIASGLLYTSVNASNLTRQEVIPSGSKIENSSNITETYQWRIKTDAGIYSGVSKTMDQVNEDIAAVTRNNKIITKSITPLTISENIPNKNIYTWSIVTKKGHASGQTTSLVEAKNMLKAFNTQKVIKSNIIETKAHE